MLKWDVVETSLQVQHAYPLSLPQLSPVLPYAIELVLALDYLFVDQDDILADLVGLVGLYTQD